MKKKILFISNNFWPENFRSFDAVNLIKEKIDVTVLTGHPTYPEKKYYKYFNLKDDNKIKSFLIYRVPTFKRTFSKLSILLNYISFILNGILIGTIKLKNKKFDYVICFASSPIYQSILTLWFSKLKKCKSIIWVQDIWPETLEEIGYIKNFLIKKIIKSTVNLLYKNHDLILTQSISYRNYLIKSFPNTKYLPNPVDKFDNILKQTKILKIDNKIKYITYTGNIGLAQNFDLLLKAAKFYKNNSFIRFLIIGNGIKFESIEKKIIDQKLKNIVLLEAKPREEIADILKKSDVLFLSLNHGFISNHVIPAKFQTYTSFSKPILAHANGDVKKLIRKYNCGFIVDNDNFEMLKKCIDTIIKYPKSDLKIIGNNSKKLFDKEFSNEIFTDKFMKIIYEN